MFMEVKAKGVIMHAKSVNCGHTAFMRCSLGSCMCMKYTCKPVEVHFNHIPLFPFGSNHTLSDRNIGNTHYDSHGNAHTYANTAASGCICCIPFCTCAGHYSPVWVHRVWHSVLLLLCPADQVQKKGAREDAWKNELFASYARLTLICFTCNFCYGKCGIRAHSLCQCYSLSERYQVLIRCVAVNEEQLVLGCFDHKGFHNAYTKQPPAFIHACSAV